jgi:lysophospholipase L1-like esterase
LVTASPKLYAEKLRAVGMAVRIDAVGSRALRFGWQCRDATGRLVILKQPSSGSCRREGLEVLSNLRRTNALPDAVVIALGTNDAGLFTPAEIVSSLDNARTLIGERPLSS